MFPHLKGFNLKNWIEDNRGNWGQRRVIWQDSDFIAFVTRGPNRRKDFHINPGDEIFYQLEGELNLHYFSDGKAELAVLKAGELFLMPGHVPHSPRRADGSWTSSLNASAAKRDGPFTAVRKCGNSFMKPCVSTIRDAVEEGNRLDRATLPCDVQSMRSSPRSMTADKNRSRTKLRIGSRPKLNVITASGLQRAPNFGGSTRSHAHATARETDGDR
jgi:3-hydroxyanthranilate 3,4-dioxygenase